MIVMPYKRTPVAPTVCLLTETGDVVSEHGERVDLDRFPPNHRVWCSWETARALVREGRGQALCWRGEEVRWRHKDHGDENDWHARASDVYVLKLPFPDDTERATMAICDWRDWLERYGAAPTGTTGSAAWSLLRARVPFAFACSRGAAPPLKQTMGGRVELGPVGAGSFTGRIEQWDMSAAYASELAGCRYGGRWFQVSSLPGKQRPLEWWSASGEPLFVVAKVRLSDGWPGGLVRRPTKKMSPMRMMLDPDPRFPYGSGRTMSGVWAWQELEAAERAGCRILEVRDAYVHLSGRLVFEDWWTAIVEGRRMRGMAGTLAKMTGNALWGRFCMDSGNGSRSIRSRSKGRRRRFHLKALPTRPGPLPAHDLAETVSGRVRARLLDAIGTVGPDAVIAVHTDGMWLRAERGDRRSELEETGWRRKEQARRLDVLDPQMLRFWPRRREGPEYVVSGSPATEAPEAFKTAWERAGFALDDDE